MKTNFLPEQKENLRLARDPTTPGATLEELSYMSHPILRLGSSFIADYDRSSKSSEKLPWGVPYAAEIWCALAANPNTPLRLLARIAVNRPDEFLSNPVAPLVMLEAPQFAEWMEEETVSLRLSGHAVSILLRRPTVPKPLVAALATKAKDHSLRQEASLHVAFATPAELEKDLGTWREQTRRVLCARARTLRGTNRQSLLDMVEAGVAPHWIVDAAVLAEPPPSPNIEGRWARPPRNSAATNPDTPAEKLLLFSKQHNRSVHKALAENPATPAGALCEILDLWRDHWQEDTLWRMIALRPELPASVITRLVTSSDPATRRIMRQRGYGTGADSFSPKLRYEATRASVFCEEKVAPVLGCLTLAGLPPEYDADKGMKMALRVSAEGRQWLARLGVALCPRLSAILPDAVDVLNVLADDGNRLVRAAARARLAGEVGI